MFEHVYKDYLWGGGRLAQVYGRTDTPPVCAESWEISDRLEGMSVVRNGPLAGIPLAVLSDDCRADLYGTHSPGPAFPLLIKLIDAKANLSVQVHPDDQSSARFGGEPKTEMWYVLDAQPGSRIYAGMREPTTPEAFLAAVREGRAEELLHVIEPEAGTAIYVPGGRVHAIGAGCLLLEVQQNSNTTYRIYDWNRVDSAGKPRELHLEQAMNVIRWDDAAPSAIHPRLLSEFENNRTWHVMQSPYFHVTRHDIAVREEFFQTKESFTALFVVRGVTRIETDDFTGELRSGETCLVPAALDSYNLSPVHGSSTILSIRTA
jgi:mannose-6-phosphate isomerase